jgi:L-arabinose isomerase
MADVELVVIDADTRLREFKRSLKAGDQRLT